MMSCPIAVHFFYDYFIAYFRATSIQNRIEQTIVLYLCSDNIENYKSVIASVTGSVFWE